MTTEPKRRTYRMGRRAEAAEATTRKLLDAAIELIADRPYDEVTLDAVASKAGVTLQTLLRKFGSKAGLLAAAAKHGNAEVIAQRNEAPANESAGAIRNLFEHYEKWADVALRLLEQEAVSPEMAKLAKGGRREHAAWVERVFEDALLGHRGDARRILRAQLIAICDVYVWKLFRRDLGMSRRDAERAVRGLVDSITRARARKGTGR